MPSRQDKWWQVNDRSDMQEIAGQITEAWEYYGRRWIEEFSDLRAARDKETRSGDLRLASQMSLALGEIEEAQRLLNEYVLSHPNRDHTWFVDWATKHGLQNPLEER